MVEVEDGGGEPATDEALLASSWAFCLRRQSRSLMARAGLKLGFLGLGAAVLVFFIMDDMVTDFV